MNRYAYNQDWYAIKYGLAAVHANHWVKARRENADRPDGSEPSQESLSEVERLRLYAFGVATETALTACETLQRLRAHPLSAPIVAWQRSRVASPARRAQLAKYLYETMLPTTLVLLAGVTVASEGLQQFADLEGLVAALRQRAADPQALVDYVLRLPKRSARVDYNLGCYYAERRDRDQAREMLRASLVATPPSRRAGLAERAAHDPTLGIVLTPNTAEGVLKDLLV
jgi:hypothetical protein